MAIAPQLVRSIQVYVDIVSRLPDVVRDHVDSFEDPETTYVTTRMQQLIEQYPLDFSRGIHCRLERRMMSEPPADRKCCRKKDETGAVIYQRYPSHNGTSACWYEHVPSQRDIATFFTKENVRVMQHLIDILPKLYDRQMNVTEKSVTAEEQRFLEVLLASPEDAMETLWMHFSQNWRQDRRPRDVYDFSCFGLADIGGDRSITRGQTLMGFALCGFPLKITTGEVTYVCKVFAKARRLPMDVPKK